MQVRRAEVDDIDGLARVQAAAAIEGYRGFFPASAPEPTAESLRAGWAALIDSDEVSVFAAPSEPHGDPIGGVVARPDPDAAGVHLVEKLYVDPRWWGRGVGTALLDAAIGAVQRAGARSAALWVLEQNERARSWYERVGWRLEPGRTLRHPGDVVEVRYSIGLDGR